MSKNVRRISYAAIAAAIVFAVTRMIVITYSSSGSYINFGDMSIYIIAYLIGGPLAAPAAAIGSAMADLTSFPIYAPATLIVKGLMGLTAGLLMRNKTFGMYVLACVVAGAIMVAGYGLYDLCIFGWGTTVVNAPGNLIQWSASVAIAAILYPIAQRIQNVTHFDDLR